jgi:dihydroorotate dehydrogenase
MPDWSYRTVFQPLLLRLPVALARRMALGGIGTLAKLPGGGRVIDFMGHMAPDAALGFEKCGLQFPSRVGLGHLIDPTGSALAAMARFGFGCIEVGPLDWEAEIDRLAGMFDTTRQRVVSLAGSPAVCFASLRRHQASRSRSGPPVLLRLSLEQFNSDTRRIQELLPNVDGLVLVANSSSAVADMLLVQLISGGKPLIWRCGHDGPLPLSILEALKLGQLQGVLVEEEVLRRTESAPSVVSRSAKERPISERQATLTDLICQVREQIGPEVLLLARGHVIDPQDYLDLRYAGADLVLIDDGLVFSGPGLSKRINEAELARIPIPPTPLNPRRGPESWVWTLLLGVALFGGGWLALLIALTRVILPYDEAFVGMNREQLCGVNDRLVDFMSHDRVTLAGTMIALGLCYSMLSIFGSRQGRHWAQVTTIASSFVGFFSFFAFLGYGYFDPFHAFVAAILFQFMLFGLAAPLSPVRDRVTPTLREDRPWRLAQWGQLLLIAHAVALMTAGVVILGVGSTSVFVTEDLEFMNTTAATLSQANPRIIPLIAHDRASFGGMLLSCGLATLLPVLWGFERARPWLWHMLAGAGVAGYLCAITVHFAVGYVSAWHLAPAFGGALVLAVGLGLSRPYLGERPGGYPPAVRSNRCSELAEPLASPP